MEHLSSRARFLSLAMVGLLIVGAGCSRDKGTTSTDTVTETTTETTATDTTVEATVETPDEPTGDTAEDTATVEDTLNQMKAAEDEAASAVDSAESSDSVDDYTLPTTIPE